MFGFFKKKEKRYKEYFRLRFVRQPDITSEEFMDVMEILSKSYLVSQEEIDKIPENVRRHIDIRKIYEVEYE